MIDLGLLKDFQAWKAVNRPDFSLRDYLAGRGDWDLAVAFAQLFWPEFVEHDGCVFMAYGFSVENYDHWKAVLNGDRERIEHMINHQHVAELFPTVSLEDEETGVVEWFGQMLATSWEAALKRRFPERQFVVDYDRGGDEDGTPWDPEITFCQVRGASPSERP